MVYYVIKNFGHKYFIVLPSSVQNEFHRQIFVVKLPRVQLDITYFLSDSSGSSVGGVGGTLELPCIKAKF